MISDTQSPIWVEELFLSSNDNEKARRILFNQIISTRPNAVFHLGDLVALGYSDESWGGIDQFLTDLSKVKTPFYPTIGNHELMFFSDQGESNFNARFPFYSKTGYVKTIGSIAFILLNSNFSNLSEEEIDKQQQWYKNQLIYCDTDPSIKAVIVGSHHPPFTNSKIVNSNEDVQLNFLPNFLASDKTKLFLSGHSHSFEHFSQAGKDFLTIGGGGGLHHPLYKGEEILYKDLYEGDLNKRSFHYLQCCFDNDGMKVQIKMLNSDFSEINTVYSIEYSFHDTLVAKIQ